MNRKLLPNDQWERIKDLLPGQKGDPGQISRATDCSLKLCCGLHGLGPLGPTCFLPLATGIVFTRATPVGAKKGVGNLCWNRSPMILIWNNFSSIAQSFEFISMAQVQKKKGFRPSIARLVD